MRPRPDAAENTADRRRRKRSRTRFNEAAARCRGKLATDGSSRPPRCRFNEAAARCRGKPTPGGRRSIPHGRFNEAAARCRGKLGDYQLDTVINLELQ